MNEALSREEKDRLMEDGFEDPVFFCRTFLPEWFPGPMPWVHRGMLAIMLRRTDFLHAYGELDKIVENFTYKVDPDDPESPEENIFTLEDDGTITIRLSPFTLLMLPRGYSKTTLVNAVCLISILYQLREFIAYLSETGPHAENQLGNVKRELEDNELIRAVFGNLVPGRQDSQKWSHNQIETLTGIFMIARGRGGQVRGSNLGAKRPDLILFDDVEDEESVNTSEQIQKTRKWFYQAVMPALAKLKPGSQIVGSGTLLHRDALLNVLAHDPQWTVVKFGALDKKGEPLWSKNLDLVKLADLKQSFARVNDLAGYYREYFNVLRSDDTAKFRSDWIRVSGIDLTSVVGIGIALDPAISQSKDADYASIAAVAELKGGMLAVLQSKSKRGVLPREQLDWLFEEFHRWRGVTGVTPLVGIESIAFQAALIHIAREEMFRRKTYFEIAAIKHSQKKETRVEGVLQPRYASSTIFHTGSFPELVEQLLDWPNGKKDAPDAVAMAVTLLDPYAAVAGMGPDGPAPWENQYEPLNQKRFRHAP